MSRGGRAYPANVGLPGRPLVRAPKQWPRGRSEPYSTEGIGRAKCIRCGCRAKYQWNICSDDNAYRPICEACDIELNRLVLEFMRHPNVDGAIAHYKENLP